MHKVEVMVQGNKTSKRKDKTCIHDDIDNDNI